MSYSISLYGDNNSAEKLAESILNSGHKLNVLSTGTIGIKEMMVDLPGGSMAYIYHEDAFPIRFVVWGGANVDSFLKMCDDLGIEYDDEEDEE